MAGFYEGLDKAEEADVHEAVNTSVRSAAVGQRTEAPAGGKGTPHPTNLVNSVAFCYSHLFPRHGRKVGARMEKQ